MPELPLPSRDRGASPRAGAAGAVLAALLALGPCEPGGVPPAGEAPEVPAAPGVPQGSASAAVIEAAVTAGRLETLLRPDWPDLQEPVVRLYRTRAFRPVWLEGGRPTPQALAVLALIQGADAWGLAAADYDGLRWPDRVIELQQGASEPAQGRFDVALTVSTLRLARDLHRGRVDPRSVSFALEVEPKLLDLPVLVEELIAAPDPAARLAAVEPPFPGYRRLKAALVRYLELSRGQDETPLPEPAGGVLRPGDRYPALADLARLLARLGDLAREELVELERRQSDLYDGGLVAAVERFQTRHGLEPDGKVGPLTLAELAVPLSRRARQIELALERWRWAPVDLPRPPIVVNIPEFRLRAFDGEGRVALAMNVVVGMEFRSETPVFADLLRTVVFRPYWNVPVSIARRDVVPRAERDPGYLARDGFEILGAPSQELTPEVLAALRRGSLTLRQRPGPANALGRVKFMFPNVHSVYLHDTPATGVFARARRDLSSGCIRVADPVGLAAWVLRDRPEWTEERIRLAMHGERQNLAVAVTPPIPVLLVYLTAVAAESGEVLFFRDLYGHDATLEAALAERHEPR